MNYSEYLPEDADKHAVRVTWMLEGTTKRPTAEPIAPDGCAELIFHTLDTPQHMLSDGTLTVQPQAMLVGPMTGPLFVRLRGSTKTVGIRLQPWATFAVFGIPAAELRDEVLPLAELSSLMKRLASRAIDDVAADANLSHLQQLIAAKALRNNSVRTSAQPIIRAIGQADRVLSVRELASMLGRSVRSVQRSFFQDVGISPRTVLRIARVQRALRIATLHPNRPWIRVALEAGYFDQSHFVREFKDLVGVLPSEYRADPESLTTSFVEHGEYAAERLPLR